MSQHSAAYMPDPQFTDSLNVTALQYLTSVLSDQPGTMRGNDGEKYGRNAVAIATSAYNLAQLGMFARAEGLHKLAWGAVHFGYGREAMHIAMASDALDADKILMADNLRLKAYVVGMIDGNYNASNGLYSTVEKIQRDTLQWDDAARIESYIHKGITFYGMSKTVPAQKIAEHILLNASAQFEQASYDVRSSLNLSDQQREDLRVRTAYGYARTLTHIASNSPMSFMGVDGIRMAHGLLSEAAMCTPPSARHAFRRACIKAAEGDMLAAMGDAKAHDMLSEALADQVAANPTVMPRLVATEAKIYLLEGETNLRGKMRKAVERLRAFYGYTRKKDEHPSFAYYERRFADNAQPRTKVFTIPRSM